MTVLPSVFALTYGSAMSPHYISKNPKFLVSSGSLYQVSTSIFTVSQHQNQQSPTNFRKEQKRKRVVSSKNIVDLSLFSITFPFSEAFINISLSPSPTSTAPINIPITHNLLQFYLKNQNQSVTIEK